MNDEIAAYNDSLSEDDGDICRRRTVHIGQRNQSQRPDSLAKKVPRHPVGRQGYRKTQGCAAAVEVGAQCHDAASSRRFTSRSIVNRRRSV